MRRRIVCVLVLAAVAACGGGKSDGGETWTFRFDGVNDTNLCDNTRYCIEGAAVLSVDGALLEAINAGSRVSGTGSFSANELPTVQCMLAPYTILPSEQTDVAVTVQASTVSFEGLITIRSVADEPLIAARVQANANGGDRSAPFDLISMTVTSRSSTTIAGTWDMGSGGPSVGNNSMGTFTAERTGSAGGEPMLEGNCGPMMPDAGVDAAPVDAMPTDAAVDAPTDAMCDCTGLVHASGITCPGGVCDYAACDVGYLDCDASRATGCEQEGLDCVFVIATGQPQPVGMAIDATNLYWINAANAGGPMRMALSGGAPVPLALSQLGESIAVDSTHVYWTGSDRVKRVPIAGGSFQIVDSTGFLPTAIAVDDTDVYWVRPSAYQLVRMPKSGGTITEVYGNTQADPQPGIYAIALDASTVYWSQQDTRNRVGRISKTLVGPAVTTSFPVPYGIAPAGSDMVMVGDPAGVGKVATAGGTVTPLVPSGNVRVVAVGGGNVYWGGNGRIGRVALAGGTSTVLASGQDPAGIVVDATYVYWTNRSQGTIGRVPK